MDVQKIINNAFFTLVSTLLSYGVSQLGKISDKIGQIEQSVYQLNGQAGVQREINERIADAVKDHEYRLRKTETRGG